MKWSWRPDILTYFLGDAVKSPSFSEPQGSLSKRAGPADARACVSTFGAG